MTVTHPSVMTLEPVTEGRHPVRVTAPTVKPTRPETPAREPEPQVKVDPRTAEQERELIYRRTQSAIVIAGAVGKTVAVAAMVFAVYLAITQGWISSITDTLTTWYAATVAPQFAFEPLVPQLPVGDGSLFTTAPPPSFVITD